MPFDFKFPDIGEGVHEGEIVKWMVKEGDFVKEHDVLVKIETDKAVVEVPSPKDGVILKIYHKEGEKIQVGDVLVTLGEKGERVSERPVAKVPEASKPYTASVVGYLPEKPEAAGQILATPATRRLAKELGVDISKIKGSGLGGRITDDDVRKTTGGKVAPTAQVTAKLERKAPYVTFDKYGSVLRIPIRGVRKSIAEKMTKSASTIPHAVAMGDADVTELTSVREKAKIDAEKKGVKLTFMPYVIKAILASMKQNPYLNSSFDDETQEILVKKYFNIGIAVDTTEGLMVFVLKNADKKAIFDLAKESQELAEKARNREISLEDLKGSTFTITNWGSIGGTYGMPIINYPEAAILGLGRIQEKPVVKDGKIVVRKMLPLSISFDHRVVDGAQVARFLDDLVRYLEDPNSLLATGV